MSGVMRSKLMERYFKEHSVAMSDGVKLYTYTILPEKNGTFPIVFYRTPYREIRSASECIESHQAMLDDGYAVVYQHCRGTGGSQGDFIPYIHERKDGLDTIAWIREQPFYQGEIYPCGGSYMASVHLLYLDTRPHDVKGAILEVMDSNRYNLTYRNGILKCGHGNWYAGMYKKRGNTRKSFVPDSYRTMPLTCFSQIVFGEKEEAFDEVLRHPDPADGFWKTTMGGYDTYRSVIDADIPILLTTAHYDPFLEGMLEMWEEMKPENRKNSAMLVTPYEHAKVYCPICPIKFEKGDLAEVCTKNYMVNWLNHIRSGEPLEFIRKGEITYYALFKNEWQHEERITDGTNRHDYYLNKQSLGKSGAPSEEISYTYNPYAPASFKGGACNNFGGMQVQDEPNSRYDIISFISEPIDANVYVKGSMHCALYVKTDCEDTCFYVRVSIIKDEIAYSLRDDITSVCWQHPDYTPNTEVKLDFSFAPHAFEMQKGDRLRVDVSSSAFPLFCVHTNQKGLQCDMTTAKPARNTIVCGKSSLTFFAE